MKADNDNELPPEARQRTVGEWIEYYRQRNARNQEAIALGLTTLGRPRAEVPDHARWRIRATIESLRHHVAWNNEAIARLCDMGRRARLLAARRNEEARRLRARFMRSPFSALYLD